MQSPEREAYPERTTHARAISEATGKGRRNIQFFKNTFSARTVFPLWNAAQILSNSNYRYLIRTGARSFSPNDLLK